MRLTQTRRPSSFAATASIAVLTGCLMLATPTLAQQRVTNPGDGRTPGMRYLTWPGKAEAPRPSRAVTAPAPAYPGEAPEARPEAEPRGPILSMPTQPLVAPVATRYSARTSPGPTPASAWISNGGAPAPSAYAEATPTPPAYSGPTYDPTPTSTFVPAPPLETALRARNAPPAYEARVATLPEPPRGYAPVLPLSAPAPRSERTIETPTYAPPVYSAPVEDAPVDTPRFDDRPVAADTGPAATEVAPAPVAVPLPREVAPPQPTPPAPEPVAPAPSDAPAAAPTVDPYAPRPDAPIFRLLNRNSQPAPAPAPAPTPEATPAPASGSAANAPAPQPAQQTSQTAPQPYPAAPTDVDRTPRRYSVHRGNGQSPDRVPLPDPVMLDSAPVDLAEPPETPTVVRNVNGRLTAITPSAEDPAQP